MTKAELWLLNQGLREEDLVLAQLDHVLGEVEKTKIHCERFSEGIKAFQNEVTDIMTELSKMKGRDKENNVLLESKINQLKELSLTMDYFLGIVHDN